MRPKLVDRLVASAVFAYALVLYLLTVAPTVSLWDTGLSRVEDTLRLAQKAEPGVLRGLKQAQTGGSFRQAAGQAQSLRYLYMQVGAFEEAAAFSKKLASATGDPALRQNARELRQSFRKRRAPRSSAPPSESTSVPSTATPTSPATPAGNG